MRAYGEEGKQVAGQGGSMTDFSRKIDDAREQIDGDNATITVEEEEPMHLRRIDQEWKIDLGRAMPEGEEITRAIRVMNAMAAAARDTTAEITSGQLETAQAAQQALGQRIMAVMMGAMSEE